jgi:hypothetical protein
MNHSSLTRGVNFTGIPSKSRAMNIKNLFNHAPAQLNRGSNSAAKGTRTSIFTANTTFAYASVCDLGRDRCTP